MSTHESKKRKNAGGGGKGKSERTDNGEVRWFNPEPSRQDVSVLESDEYDPVASIVALLDDIPPGDRVTVKYDVHSERFLALYFRSPDDADMPMEVMSVRGATPFDATVLLAYCHLVKFSGEWGGGEPAPTGRFG